MWWTYHSVVLFRLIYLRLIRWRVIRHYYIVSIRNVYDGYYFWILLTLSIHFR